MPMLGHIAALALVGCLFGCSNMYEGRWYLMAPPETATKKPDFQAPISNWQRMATFDSYTDCSRESARRAKIGMVVHAGNSTSTVVEVGRDWFDACVSTDDPRLKPH
jgi:hypothetical protein